MRPGSQLRPRQRIQAAPADPGQEAAQIRLGVVAGGALEPGQVASHRQPRLISDRHKRIGGDGGQLCEVHHDPTLRKSGRHREARESVPGAAEQDVWVPGRCESVCGRHVGIEQVASGTARAKRSPSGRAVRS